MQGVSSLSREVRSPLPKPLRLQHIIVCISHSTERLPEYAMTTKLDLYKEHKQEYIAPKKPTLVTARRATYLAITGSGQPGGEQFQSKIAALYGMAYTLKFTWKHSGKGDYGVAKLEGLYWWDDDKDPQTAPIDEVNWQLLIRTPDFIKRKHLAAAATQLIEKGKSPEVKEVELVSLAEGKCVQMLHIGPYDREEDTVDQMLAFAESEGYEVHRKHHEIYLSDPRRVAPEKLKTILRHPVRRAAK